MYLHEWYGEVSRYSILCRMNGRSDMYLDVRYIRLPCTFSVLVSHHKVGIWIWSIAVLLCLLLWPTHASADNNKQHDMKLFFMLYIRRLLVLYMAPFKIRTTEPIPVQIHLSSPDTRAQRGNRVAHRISLSPQVH